ncbi:MAG: DsbA family protein, partial [Patescibacteria group bacterium]
MPIAKQTNQWLKRILVGLCLGLVIAGFVWLITQDVQRTQQTATNLEVDLTGGSDWIRGNGEARAVVVEYSDFQCPACAAYEPVVDRMLEELGDQVVLVYRHYPLTSIHNN